MWVFVHVDNRDLGVSYGYSLTEENTEAREMQHSRTFFARIASSTRRRFHILRKRKEPVFSRVLRFPIYEGVVKQRFTGNKTEQPKFFDSRLLGFLANAAKRGWGSFIESARREGEGWNKWPSISLIKKLAQWLERWTRASPRLQIINDYLFLHL